MDSNAKATGTLDKSGRNQAQTSIKSMPVTEGSIKTIGEDTVVKNTPIISDDIPTKTVQEEDEYSVPAGSQEGEDAQYSNEDFEDEVKSPDI